MKLTYKILLLSLLIFSSCGGGDDSPPPEMQPMAVVPDPKATTLVFPQDNTECNEGDIIDALRSKVTFQWNVSEDTDSYEVNIRNITTNENITTSINTEDVDITIERGTPYEWFVISKAIGTTVTASSAKFKFYNQGPGIENYAPFPAEAVNPARGADVTNSGGTVTLEWKGTDIDDDITEYEVFFGTNETPTESLGTTSSESFDVTVAANSVYYWRIVISDTQGNTSQSEVFEFNVSS
jgi:hypothetical protein